MPDLAANGDLEISQRNELRRWSDRIGAALVAPKLALRASETLEGQGRASSDITLLLLLAIVAVQTDLFATAGWMLGDGDFRGALTVILVGARGHLILPIILLLSGSALLSLLSGRRRSLANDFDLTCVALTPIVVVELLHALLAKLGLSIDQPSVWLGYSWSLALMVLALKVARNRGKTGARDG